MVVMTRVVVLTNGPARSLALMVGNCDVKDVTVQDQFTQ